MSATLFPLGQTVITSHAREALHPADLAAALSRHADGDWGDIATADWQENEIALMRGFRLFSAYRDRCGVRFWIITEANRSITTVLLPNDY